MVAHCFSLKLIRSLQFSKNWNKLLLKAFLWTDEQERTKSGPEKNKIKNNLILIPKLLFDYPGFSENTLFFICVFS